MKNALLGACLLLPCIPDGKAKRAAPPEVAPVTADGIVYSAPPFGNDPQERQQGGYLQAIDAKSGKVLWKIQVYRTSDDPLLETDVQDVFIRTLSLDEAHRILVLTDEKDRTYSVDLDSHQVSGKIQFADTVDSDGKAQTIRTEYDVAGHPVLQSDGHEIRKYYPTPGGFELEPSSDRKRAALAKIDALHRKLKGIYNYDARDEVIFQIGILYADEVVDPDAAYSAASHIHDEQKKAAVFVSAVWLDSRLSNAEKKAKVTAFLQGITTPNVRKFVRDFLKKIP